MFHNNKKLYYLFCILTSLYGVLCKSIQQSIGENGRFDQHSLKTYAFHPQNGKAIVGTLPYQVAVFANGRPLCGGSLITSRHVLSAAHCFKTIPKKLEVLAGGVLVQKNVINGQNGWQVREVSNVFVHDDYSINATGNDIALLYVVTEFDLSEHVLPIKLNLPGIKVANNCVISGWGKTSYKGRRSSELLFTFVPIIAHDVCARLYEKLVELPDAMLCAGLIDTGGRDACQGDSGGPLACGINEDGNFKEYYLTGIVSAGEGCGDKNYPGVYTEVSKYLYWIQEAAHRATRLANLATYISVASARLVFLVTFILIYII